MNIPKRACQRRHKTLQPDTCNICRGFVPRTRKGEQRRKKLALTCIYLGEPTGEQRICLSCQKTPPVTAPVFACSVHGACTTDRGARQTACCKSCSQKKVVEPRFSPRAGDPPVGIVIGSYGFPGIVALQIATIRKFCGPVPILVSDDQSPDQERLRRDCDQPGVTLAVNPIRYGHTGGDLTAFWRAATWGKEQGMAVVAKLSQRFLVEIPRWLQDGAIDLLKAGLPIASQRCRGVETFDLRSEACLLSVEQWNRPDVLDWIAPRRRPKPEIAETTVWRAVKMLGGLYWPWKVIGEDRYTQVSGVVWHCSNRRQDYFDLAQEFGIELDEKFHTDGWQNDREYLR